MCDINTMYRIKRKTKETNDKIYCINEFVEVSLKFFYLFFV